MPENNQQGILAQPMGEIVEGSLNIRNIQNSAAPRHLKNPYSDRFNEISKKYEEVQVHLSYATKHLEDGFNTVALSELLCAVNELNGLMCDFHLGFFRKYL